MVAGDVLMWDRNALSTLPQTTPAAAPGPARFGGIIDEMERQNTAIRPASSFNQEGVNPQAIAALAQLEAAHGSPFSITSAYRNPSHNAQVGGANRSQHMNGNAFDIDVRNMSIPERQELIRLARAAGFSGIGVYNNSLHFDVGPSRYWGPSYRADSLPAWAREVVGAPVGALPQNLPAGVPARAGGGGVPAGGGMASAAQPTGRGGPMGGEAMPGNVFASTLPQEVVEQVVQRQHQNALRELINQPIYDFRMSGGNALGGMV
jgi:hypothetical protein